LRDTEIIQDLEDRCVWFDSQVVWSRKIMELEKEISLAKQVGDMDEQMRILPQVADCYKRLGKYEKAANCFIQIFDLLPNVAKSPKECFKFLQRIGDLNFILDSLFIEAENLEKASEYFTKILEECSSFKEADIIPNARKLLKLIASNNFAHGNYSNVTILSRLTRKVCTLNHSPSLQLLFLRKLKSANQYFEKEDLITEAQINRLEQSRNDIQTKFSHSDCSSDFETDPSEWESSEPQTEFLSTGKSSNSDDTVVPKRKSPPTKEPISNSPLEFFTNSPQSDHNCNDLETKKVDPVNVAPSEKINAARSPAPEKKLKIIDQKKLIRVRVVSVYTDGSKEYLSLIPIDDSVIIKDVEWLNREINIRYRERFHRPPPSILKIVRASNEAPIIPNIPLLDICSDREEIKVYFA
jgi:hypothetical protein